ncbi:MAG: NAD-dependent epimerase/dehydratase family protein, partial [Gemmatimonadaceae bacterium]
VRTPAARRDTPGLDTRRIDLPDEFPDDALGGADVVVHAAYATQQVDRETSIRVNMLGTRRVVDAARRSGTRLVFVSSLSAHEGALSSYGRGKLAVEATLDPARDLIIRPGLVLAADGGLAFRMWRSVARSPIIPLFDGGEQETQTIHIDDLCLGIANAIEAGTTGLLTLAEPDGITLRALLTLFAQSLEKDPTFVSLPSRPSQWLLRLVELTRLPLPVSSENLLGLMSLRTAEAGASASRVGLRVRPSHESVESLAPLVRASLGGAA